MTLLSLFSLFWKASLSFLVASNSHSYVKNCKIQPSDGLLLSNGVFLHVFLCFKLHLLHWNPKYSNYLDAKRRTDGIAVLAIFLQVSRSMQPFFALIL